jgi:pimeloyl-ACP methyl ester carboxylesterase
LFRALRHVPVLALRGAFSDVLTKDTFERMGRENPHLVRVTVPGVGHAPGLDERESQEAMDEFFARL